MLFYRLSLAFTLSMFVATATGQSDCNPTPDLDQDGVVGMNDLLNLLSAFGDSDLDFDGIWDSVDDCVGAYDPCGICNGGGADVDEDGVCDDEDDCVGEYDQCGVCNGPGPNIPIINEVYFEIDSVFIEQLGEWYVFEYATDTLFSYICPISGCTDPEALNYNPEAVIDNGTCGYDNSIYSNCFPQTPEPLTSDGLDCSLYSPHSLRLFGEYFFQDQFYVQVEGQAEHLENGGWSLNQTVVSTENSESGWFISMTYGQGYTWDEWLELPGSQGYMQGCGEIEDLHEQWMYYILAEGTLTGYGSYDGIILHLAHQPANNYFGLQMGEGASRKNGNYGYVAWFLYEGAEGGVPIMGSGDIFGDLDCVLE